MCSCVLDADKGSYFSVIGSVGCSNFHRFKCACIESCTARQHQVDLMGFGTEGFYFCHSSALCCQPQDRTPFSSCYPRRMMQGLKKFE